MAVAFLTFPVPQVHARESIAIKELHYPSEIVVYKSGVILDKETQMPSILSVAGTVSYAGIEWGSHLDVSVWEVSVNGTNPASSCKVTGQISSSCQGIRISGSGSKRFQFELVTPVQAPAGFWNLTVRAAVLTPQARVLCEDHRDFMIMVTREVELAVVAPDKLAIDGTSYWRSRVLNGLTGVPHELSVPDLVRFDNETRLRFLQWTDGSTAAHRTVTLTDDAKFEATYVTQYFLTLTNPFWENGTRTGWYDKDSTVQLQALPIHPMSGLFGMLGCKWRFQGWYEYANLRASVPMDRPHALAARYQADYTPLIIVLMVVAALVSVVTILEVPEWREKLLMQARLSSTRRGRGATAFVIRILLTVVLVFVSLRRTIITVILGRKEAHVITWRETESPRRATSVAQIMVAKIDISNILDPVTGTGFNDGELAWKCTNCQMFYHDQTYSFLRDQNSSRCVGCGQSRLEQTSLGEGKVIPFRPERPSRPDFETRVSETDLWTLPRQPIVFEPAVVRLPEINQYVGHMVYFQGKVVEVQRSRSTNTYCVKFQRGPWTSVFKLVVFPNYVHNFTHGERSIRDYEHKTIRVRGLIQKHPEWGFEILVYNEDAITVVD